MSPSPLPTAVAVALLLACHTLGAQPARLPNRCERSAWSEPRILRMTMYDSAVLHPQRVAESATQFVVASEFPRRLDSGNYMGDDQTPIATRFDLATGAVRQVMKPSPLMSYRGMRVLIDANDVAHLFWGEAAGVTSPDSTGGPGAVQLWTMQLAADSTSTPRMLYSSTDFRWEPDPGENVHLDEAGRIHVFLIGRAGLTRHVAVHLTRSPSGWSADTIDGGMWYVPTYLESAVANGQLHVGFVSTPPLEQGGGMTGSVYYVRKRIGDATWSPVYPIQRSPAATPARAPHLTVAPNGDIRMLWLQVVDNVDFLTSRAIRLVVIADSAPVVTHRREFRGLDAMRRVERVWTDPCGETHMHLVSGFVNDRTDAHTVSWDGSRWSVEGPFSHRFLFVGRSPMSQGPRDLERRIWSTVFVAPNLPVGVFWWEAHRRVVVPR